MAATAIRTRRVSSFSYCFRTESLRQAVRRTTPIPIGRTLNIFAPRNQPSDFAFAFDIDGVLLRSSDPLPGATESLALLQHNRIPFILLTNGGGKHEEDRAIELSDQLKVPLETSMLVQSHTPFTELVHGGKLSTFIAMKHRCILVVGGEGDNCRKVAEKYGFTNVVTPADIIMACPHIMPFAHSRDHYVSYARPLPRPLQNNDNILSVEKDCLKIDAILVFNDSRDWALDIQIIIDLLLSHAGVLGTTSRLNNHSSLPNRGFQQDGQPPLYFSNPDVLWAAHYHLPRLGQGGFRTALEGAWNDLTGGWKAGVKLQKYMFGKPYQATFEFAERRLMEHREELFGLREDNDDGENMNLKDVYMVGDNLASDIQGANTYVSPHNTTWTSILVRSGVYSDSGAKPFIPPSQRPKQIVDHVGEAVRWGIRRSKWMDGISIPAYHTLMQGSSGRATVANFQKLLGLKRTEEEERVKEEKKGRIEEERYKI